MQKYFIQCLIENNKVINYTDSKYQFNKRFPNIEYLISEENFKKIKTKILGSVKNISLEEICKSIKNLNNDIIVDIYNISTEYKNNKNEIESRDQSVIIIGHKEMIKYLDHNIGSQYGIDLTYKVIPNSFKPYKLMSLYCIDNREN